MGPRGLGVKQAGETEAGSGAVGVGGRAAAGRALCSLVTYSSGRRRGSLREGVAGGPCIGGKGERLFVRRHLF